MKCSVCHKNTAVVFMTKVENERQEKVGLCLPCAKDQGIAPLDQMLEQTGMTSDDINNINDQMMAMFEDPEMNERLNQFMDNVQSEEPGESSFSAMVDDVIDADGNRLSDHRDSADDSTYGKNGTRTKTKKPKHIKRKNLDTFGINLTQKAKDGQVDRIIGRHREVDRVIQILNRRQKNNPILIGEPGVGKTAIAEGLAVRIVEQAVPVKLLNAEIYLLDLTAVVSGTQFRGQFEGRMQAIIREASESGNVILVIDEVHNISGAGGAEGGSMNAANILKPALARGDIQIIGATTLEEYRKHIEKDSALERRFQPVLVDEPTVEESIEIIEGIKDYYEDYHHVSISREVVDYAVVMAERYIHDRFLPDKAIDVLDEAGSRANLKNQGLVELEALKNELAKIIQEKEQAAAEDDYERAADCRMEELNLEEKIFKIKQECDSVAISQEDVAYVIEAWTKIPVSSITEAEADKLLSLEDRLKRSVKGQDRAIGKLAKAIRRRRSGFQQRRRPASFVFVGPTGVGKTELARTLARELFADEEALIRFDMSEYMEKHTVSKLIGAPPGYVGYEQAGQLTEKIRRRPYSVILLDEIEKAHSDVFNLLLQILEDGRLTDSQGRTVNFENAVILMTSNAGTNQKGNGIGFNRTGDQALEDKVTDALKLIFRPEFLNRIDDIIVFRALETAVLGEIVEVMLKEVAANLKEKGFELEVSQALKQKLVEEGYSQQYGARPLRRQITKVIEDKLAEAYLRGDLQGKKRIFFDVVDEQSIWRAE